MSHQIQWIDAGKKAQCSPNPDYPNGIALDASGKADKTCTVELPYPAKGVGAYMVSCSCGQRVGCTTAGRADDPVSMKLACKK